MLWTLAHDSQNSFNPVVGNPVTECVTDRIDKYFSWLFALEWGFESAKIERWFKRAVKSMRDVTSIAIGATVQAARDRVPSCVGPVYALLSRLHVHLLSFLFFFFSIVEPAHGHGKRGALGSVSFRQPLQLCYRSLGQSEIFLLASHFYPARCLASRAPGTMITRFQLGVRNWDTSLVRFHSERATPHYWSEPHDQYRRCQILPERCLAMSREHVGSALCGLDNCSTLTQSTLSILAFYYLLFCDSGRSRHRPTRYHYSKLLYTCQAF